MNVSIIIRRNKTLQHSRVTGGRDEVEEGVHPVVAEARVTLDTGLLRKNVIVLAFQVSYDLLETD